MVPATTTGLYLYYGDYSSLDPKAQEQIRATREAMQSQRNMFETVKRLEAGVVSQPDNLEAWEILAEHYAQTGNLAQAVVAYENVVRLKPDNAVAYGELADILVATQDGDLSGKVAEYVFKALELDPYQMKSLLLGGAVAFDQATTPRRRFSGTASARWCRPKTKSTRRSPRTSRWRFATGTSRKFRRIPSRRLRRIPWG